MDQKNQIKPSKAMPAPTSAFGSLQLRPRVLPNPGQTAQLSSSAALGRGPRSDVPWGAQPCPAGAPPRCAHGNPPLATEGHCTGVQGRRLRRARGKTSERAPALALVLIACDEMMAPGPIKGQCLPKHPISSQAAPGYIVFSASSRRGHVPPAIPSVFGSASMSANVFCFDQQNCTGTGADGNRKQIEPGWNCLKRNTQCAGAKKHGPVCPVLHKPAFRRRPQDIEHQRSRRTPLPSCSFLWLSLLPCQAPSPFKCT